MKLPTSAIVFVTVSALIGLAEVAQVLVVPGFWTLQGWALADAIAQGPLAVVLLLGLGALLTGRMWGLRALLVYAVGGSFLGVTSVVDAIVFFVFDSVAGSGARIASIVFVSFFLLLMRCGYALFLLALLSRRRAREWFSRWASGLPVA